MKQLYKNPLFVVLPIKYHAPLFKIFKTDNSSVYKTTIIQSNLIWRKSLISRHNMPKTNFCHLWYLCHIFAVRQFIFCPFNLKLYFACSLILIFAFFCDSKLLLQKTKTAISIKSNTNARNIQLQYIYIWTQARSKIIFSRIITNNRAITCISQ